MQHAGTAAIALVAALAFIKDPASRAQNMQYLNCLAAALQDMTYTYQPAERMSAVLQAVMDELSSDMPASHEPTPGIPSVSREIHNSEGQYGHFNDLGSSMPKPSHHSTPQQFAARRGFPSETDRSPSHQQFTSEMATPANTQTSASTSNYNPLMSISNDFVVVGPSLDPEPPTRTWAKQNRIETSSLRYPTPATAANNYTIFGTPAPMNRPFSYDISTVNNSYLTPTMTKTSTPRFLSNPYSASTGSISAFRRPLSPNGAPFRRSNALGTPNHPSVDENEGFYVNKHSNGTKTKAMNLAFFLDSTEWPAAESRGLFVVGTGDLDGFPPVQLLSDLSTGRSGTEGRAGGI